ncbi:MAG: sigma-70 family RNA polymerase sigma factor [Thermoflexales bacterium]|nr:sigma-70 family RNA polymerase sigma factor [Thermoflexales bacterium]
MTSDQALLRRARQFDQQALGEIYDTYSPRLYRYAMRLLGEVDLSEDCVAETFSRFLHALHGGGGPTDYLQAYLYRVAHNWITDRWRRQPLPPVPLEDELYADAEAEPSQAVAQHMERERVRAALAHLTPEQRQVIVLKFLEGWENERIARTLGKPVGAVKALQHRAIASLRRVLDRAEPEPRVD